MCKKICKTPRLPDFSKWTLHRLVNEAKRLGVPSLKKILSEQDSSMARLELVSILSDAWS